MYLVNFFSVIILINLQTIKGAKNNVSDDSFDNYLDVFKYFSEGHLDKNIESITDDIFEQLFLSSANQIIRKLISCDDERTKKDGMDFIETVKIINGFIPDYVTEEYVDVVFFIKFVDFIFSKEIIGFDNCFIPSHDLQEMVYVEGDFDKNKKEKFLHQNTNIQSLNLRIIYFLKNSSKMIKRLIDSNYWSITDSNKIFKVLNTDTLYKDNLQENIYKSLTDDLCSSSNIYPISCSLYESDRPIESWDQFNVTNSNSSSPSETYDNVFEMSRTSTFTRNIKTDTAYNIMESISANRKDLFRNLFEVDDSINELTKSDSKQKSKEINDLNFTYINTTFFKAFKPNLRNSHYTGDMNNTNLNGKITIKIKANGRCVQFILRILDYFVSLTNESLRITFKLTDLLAEIKYEHIKNINEFIPRENSWSINKTSLGLALGLYNDILYINNFFEKSHLAIYQFNIDLWEEKETIGEKTSEIVQNDKSKQKKSKGSCFFSCIRNNKEDNEVVEEVMTQENEDTGFCEKIKSIVEVLKNDHYNLNIFKKYRDLKIKINECSSFANSHNLEKIACEINYSKICNDVKVNNEIKGIPETIKYKNSSLLTNLCISIKCDRDFDVLLKEFRPQYTFSKHREMFIDITYYLYCFKLIRHTEINLLRLSFCQLKFYLDSILKTHLKDESNCSRELKMVIKRRLELNKLLFATLENEYQTSVLQLIKKMVELEKGGSMGPSSQYPTFKL